MTDALESSGLLHPDSFFDHLRRLAVKQVEATLQETNRALLTLAQQEGLLPSECEVAIDMHVDPDYSRKHEGCIGYKDLPGTDHGMAYVSTESLTAPSRFTFAFTPIRAATNQEAVLKEQLAQTLTWTRVKLALLDRGFYRVYVFLALLGLGLRFVIPAPDSERVNRLKEVAWRKRQPIPGTPHSWHRVPEHELQEQNKPKRKTTVQLVFFFEPDPKDRTKDKCFVFATNPGPLTGEEAAHFATKYRQRFGIEAGYREKNEVRVRTSSAHYPTRLLLQLFSIITYNVWTLLRALRARQTGRTHPKRQDAILLRRFLRALAHALQTKIPA